MTKDRLFVERRPEGDYAVRKPNSESVRESSIQDTSHWSNGSDGRTSASLTSGANPDLIAYLLL
jgi:hypothetical protein